MVGVRVGRRVRVANGFWVEVTPGVELAVIVGLDSTDEAWLSTIGVELGSPVEIAPSAPGEGEGAGVSSVATTTCEGVACAAASASTVRAMMVGM